MTEDSVATSPAAAPATAATPKKKGVKKVSKPKVAAKKDSATHPSNISMVVEAVTKLHEKSGSSFLAIKKFISETHKVDVDRQGRFLKKALLKAVELGKLTQTKGKGASGSFKLTVKPKAEKKPKNATAAKPKKTAATGTPKVKKTAAKKASPKKKVAVKAKKPASPKKAVKAKAPAKAKSPKPIAKKLKKSVAKSAAAAKPKAASPKVKTAKAKKSPKKATAKK